MDPAPRARELSPLFDEGFHGDRYLLRLVDWLVPQVGAFVETGANVGSTARYVAHRFAPLPVHSCEQDPDACEAARRHLAPFPHARVEPRESPAFLHELHERHPRLRDQLSLYFLDAHGYGYRWPLVDEVAFLSTELERAFVLIDDFRVPGRPEFRFDEYDGQVCCLETIEPALARGRRYTLVQPAYTEHTSRHHPLVGVGLIASGCPLELPEALRPHFSVRTLAT